MNELILLVLMVIVLQLMAINYKCNNLKRKANLVATALEKLQEFAGLMTEGLNDIEADLIELKELVLTGSLTPEQVAEHLQPILDRINTVKEIQPEP